MKISFLASHGGSSARAIIQAIKNNNLAAEIGILITNNRNSLIYAWCLDNNVDVRHISSKTHRGAEGADEAIQIVLQDNHSDLVVCSGYMKKIGPCTLNAFSGKLLNIHPSLLPNFGGQGMYGDNVHAAVLKAGINETGATVHFVDDAYDEGPIVQQQKVVVLPEDDLDSLRQKVQAVEPTLYINAIRSLLTTEKKRN